LKKKEYLMLLFGMLAWLFISPNAFAHNLWLNPSDHYPKVGETVEIVIGWGHKYVESKIDQEVKEETVRDISALDPDGEIVELERKSPSLFQLKINKPGVYHVTAGINPGIFTTTPEGRKWANKKEVQHPLKCTAYNIIAKTLIIAGNDVGNLSAQTNLPLEVILLKDPSNLKKGDSLPIKVLFEGNPLAGIPLNAKYAGFDKDPSEDGHGHEHTENNYPVETTTDENGEATIMLETSGHWLILLSHRTPYPDKKTCDEYMFNAAFTFELK
jgi:uncharacterized GH25 family protein